MTLGLNEKEAEEQIKELRDALEKGNVEDIKAKKDKLQETAYKFAAKVYEEASKNAQTEENKETSDNKKDDDVIDAEFEEGK